MAIVDTVQPPPPDGWARVSQAPRYAIRAPEVHSLTSPLGGNITIGVIRPDAPGERFPVLVRASPYIRAMTPANLRTDVEYSPRVENFVPQGYVVAYVPVRGTADNGGCMEYGGAHERQDLNQALEWLANQPWSNGRLAVIGLSYDGYATWEAAAVNSHVKTIVPMAALPDLWAIVSMNGTTVEGESAQYAVYNAFGFGVEGPTPLPNTHRGMAPRIQGIICPATLEAMNSYQLDGQARPAFWNDRDVRPLVRANYRGSVYFVQGLQDTNVDPLLTMPFAAELDQSGTRMKWMLGQWGHMYPDAEIKPDGTAPAHANSRADWADLQLAWFDHELKNGHARTGPRVEVQDTTNAWREERAWPPRGATASTLLLGSNGILTGTATASSSQRVSGAPRDGTFASQGPPALQLSFCFGCARFDGPPMSAETRIVGIPSADLTVSAISASGTVGAWLYAVQAEGNTTLLSAGGVDLSFTDGSTTRHTPTPGQVLRARVMLEPLDALLPAGSYLVLVIGASHWQNAGRGPFALQTGTGSSLTVSDMVT